MALSTNDLKNIKILPDHLHTDHCFNDLQHDMILVLFRHAFRAFEKEQNNLANKLLDDISIYLCIHFLNEEEGMAHKTLLGHLSRERLIEHSEHHLEFLAHWHHDILSPIKSGEALKDDAVELLSQFNIAMINHVDGEDLADYGSGQIDEMETIAETARIAQANMPMSPYMAGAFDAVTVLEAEISKMIDNASLSPQARAPMGKLDLIEGVGRILKSHHGSLRDRFALAAGTK